MKKEILQLTLAAGLGVPGLAQAQIGPSFLSAPDGSPTNALVVDNNGRIGIGTATPFDALHLSDANRNVGPNLRLSSTLQDGSGFMGGLLFAINPGETIVNAIRVKEHTPDSYGLEFQTYGSSSGSLNTKMALMGNGNVGIGTTAPQSKLDLAGVQTRLSLSGTGEAEIAWSSQTPNQVPAWVLARRPDEGGANDDLKLLRVVNGTYQGVALQLQNATGNVGIGITTPQARLHILGDAICSGKLSAGTIELTSDQDQKQDIQPVSAAEVLAKVAALPVTTWAYTNSPTIRHLGPMAQDFKAAFNLGGDDKHIGAGDVIGVALAAIKGLHALVQEKDSQIAALHRQVASMNQELASVKDSVTDRLAALEKAVSKGQQASNDRSYPGLVPQGKETASFRPEATR